jgi:methionyl-tRNA formyltransferase
LRVVVFGYHEIGYVCLEELVNYGADVVCLFTHTDRPDEDIWFRKPRSIAEKYNIPVYTPENLKDNVWLDMIGSMAPDIIFSFYYRNMIPKSILDIPAVGAFNLHGSLLPKFRGRVPINWVLVEGEKKTGLTLHYMVEKPDAGDIVAQREVEITFEDTAYTLFMKIADEARLLMKEVLPQFKDGTFKSVPQIGTSSYYGGRKPEDGIILWDKDAMSIYNLIRAVTHPYPGAFTFLNGKKLFIWKAYPENTFYNGNPGMVVSTKPFIVNTGKGGLRLLRVQFDGEEELDGEVFALKYKMENIILGGTI